MTHHPSERELDRLLADLPRECASPGFSRRVLAGRAAATRPGIARGWLLAAAAAAALGIVLWLAPRPAPQPSLATTRALQEEHRLLVQELESLKASLRDSQEAPLLYLAGSEELDLVLDLDPVWRQPAAGFRPAVHGDAPRPVTPGDRPRGDGI